MTTREEIKSRIKKLLRLNSAKELLKKLDPGVRLKISIWAWCKRIGDVFIFSSPGPGDKKFEFDRWTEEDGDRDIIGIDFEICIIKEERRCI